METTPENLELLKKVMIDNYNKYCGVYSPEDGREVGICEYFPKVRENIERFCEFLFQTKKGEGTLISYTKITDNRFEFYLYTEIVEIEGLTPRSTVLRRGSIIVDNDIFSKPLVSYNSLGRSWCTLNHLIPFNNYTLLLSSPKKFDDLKEEELKKIEQELGLVKTISLKDLQKAYMSKKNFAMFEQGKVYI